MFTDLNFFNRRPTERDILAALFFFDRPIHFGSADLVAIFVNFRLESSEDVPDELAEIPRERLLL